MKRHFYLLCFLPDLGPFGEPPTVSRQELLAVVTESEGPVDVVQALLLSDDLLQREALLSGEIEPNQTDLAVLSLFQVKDEQPLPYFLVPEEEDEREVIETQIAVDLIWQRYFQHTLKIAVRARTSFLKAWVRFEVGLRNALAKKRAEALELDPGPYLVAPEIAELDIPFEGILAEWSSAPNPLKALEVLDKARWDWLTRHERWYSFSDDEVAAYTAKLMLLLRWYRISEMERQSAASKKRKQGLGY